MQHFSGIYKENHIKLQIENMMRKLDLICSMNHHEQT